MLLSKHVCVTMVADVNRRMHNTTDPGYLTDARDLETLQEGVHVASKMLDSQVCPSVRAGMRARMARLALSSLHPPTHGAISDIHERSAAPFPKPTPHPQTNNLQAMRSLRYGPELLPGSGFNRVLTLADTAKFAALFSGSYYHPACSCRLGEVRREIQQDRSRLIVLVGMQLIKDRS